MEKSKYSKLIAAAVIFCLICVASMTIESFGGTLLYRESAQTGIVSFETEAGTKLTAVIGEQPDDPHVSASDAGTAEYTVNINTATAQELDDLLPGIGSKKAAAIVEYRDNAGGFRSVEELIEVDGIGAKLLEQIRPYCVIAGSDGGKNLPQEDNTPQKP